MRTIIVPAPAALRVLTVRGPFPRTASRAADATLLEALDAAAAVDAGEAADLAWSVWWIDAGPIVSDWLDLRLGIAAGPDTHPVAAVVFQALRDAGFHVRPWPRPSAPRGLRVLHARLGGVRVGDLDGDHGVRFEVTPDAHARPHLAPTGSEPLAVRCPTCGEVTRPREVIAGYPTADAQLAADLGEVVLAGCVVPAPDAVCRACGAPVDLPA